MINSPAHNLAGVELLVEEVSLSDASQDLTCRVKAVSGPEMHSWVKFFEELAMGNLKTIHEGLGESEFIVLNLGFEKQWASGEHPNIFRTLKASDTLTPSDSLFPVFAPEDRVKYLEWYVGDKPVGRKAITFQESVPDLLITVTMLHEADAAGILGSSLAWIGGIDATDKVGTGIVTDQQTQTVDEESAPWSKTSRAQWQIDKYDLRW